MGDWFDPRASAVVRRATAALSRQFLDDTLPAIREAARGVGYAIAEHGSLSRDIDLIAVAWTQDASSADELVEAVMGAIRATVGRSLRAKDSAVKPHGRIAFTLLTPGVLPEIDLSVIPPKQKSGHAPPPTP